MRVFVTGATGFIGSAVVPELIRHGHYVLGLTRSPEGAKSLAAKGAEIHHGSLEDLDSLRRGAEKADAVIHLAFNHDFSRFQQNCEDDRSAIETLGSALAGSNRQLIVTSGFAGLGSPGKPAIEEDNIPATSPFPRVSEQTALSLKGVSASIVRLSQIHDTTKAGLVTFLIAQAREKGIAAYVGEGTNRWAAAALADVGALYRLALEKNEAGPKYHAVAEEGVPMRDIAEAIGRGLNIPVKSLSPEEAAAHFGWLGMFAGHDVVGSSAITRQKLAWTPTGPTLLADLEKFQY